MMKDLLLMSIRQKAGKVNWEELGANASFLPLIYLVVMAPGFLTLLGFTCFLVAALGGNSFDSHFSIGFFIKLGVSLIALGLILICTYRIIIRHQFKLKKKLSVNATTELPPSPMDHLISPFVKQLRSEQQLFLKEQQP